MISLAGRDLVFLFGELGITRGDTVLMHSSLTSIGKVDGGPEAVIDALLELIGEEGTLAMPAFTDQMTNAFDSKQTKSDVGIITEVFRKRKGVLRSCHPTHSVCALGRNAEYITRGHQFSETPCGRETPFYRVMELNGKIMLLGVDMNRNTMLHAIEEAANAQYLVEEIRVPKPVCMDFSEQHSLKNDNQVFKIRKFPSGHRDFLKLTPLLRKNGLIVEGYVGSALTGIMECAPLFSFVLNLLEKTPDFLLCRNSYCNSCVAGRKKIGGSPCGGSNKGNRCRNSGCEVCLT